ncbi:hypothetical protein ACQPYK_21890 [Streptosporangium sp. CA-135522]|uniref:hypothetical protein n=1 Tax=Streptosporangium sp. CA-135522 TaxID=3240072 RepID=UPI003D8B918F
MTRLIVALDYNIVYVALPDIGHALEFSPQSVQWTVSAYAGGLGGLLLFGGRTVDRLEIGGALGLAVFVVLTTSSTHLLDGLHLAGWTSAVTVACGLVALVIRPPLQPQRTSTLEGAGK